MEVNIIFPFLYLLLFVIFRITILKYYVFLYIRYFTNYCGFEKNAFPKSYV